MSKDNRNMSIPVYNLALSEARRVICGWFQFRFKTPVPKRMLLAPQDLRTADPSIAKDIYSGSYVFAGRAVQTDGLSPFLVEPPSREWAEAFYGFGWLRHLRATGTSLAQMNARAHLHEFMNAVGYARSKEAHESHIISRRLISFICQSPLFLDGANHTFYVRFLKNLGNMIRTLEQDLRLHPLPLRRLQAAIALCYAGLCCEGLESVFKKANKRLMEELESQILPDGGHVSRNPAVLMELLLDLLPLRQVYSSQGVVIPPAMQKAIDRMLPMLRLFCFQDGTLAHFNGTGVTATEYLATLMMYDDIRAKPNMQSPYSGYSRLEAGETVLIADIGSSPPLMHSFKAAAGCLSFELTSGASRLVINCGNPISASSRLALAARSTAAHSTLSPADSSQAVFLRAEGGWLERRLSSWLIRRLGCLMAGIQDVQVRKDESPHSVQLIASHQAYRNDYGFTHKRTWNLLLSGNALLGEDTLIFDEDWVLDEPVYIRFHLAPQVKASFSPGKNHIILELGNGEIWQFSSELLTPSLEESIFFSASNSGPRPTRQIVLSIMPQQQSPVMWRFDRIQNPVSVIPE